MSNQKYKILVVEDDEFLLELYSTKLQMEGFQVFSANDGERGLRYAKEKNPDLILLDIVLPKMDGLDVLRKIKENKDTEKIPVVLLTNLSQKDEVQEGLKAGAKDYLIKAHFMPSEVVEKIKKLLK